MSVAGGVRIESGFGLRVTSMMLLGGACAKEWLGGCSNTYSTSCGRLQHMLAETLSVGMSAAHFTCLPVVQDAYKCGCWALESTRMEKLESLEKCQLTVLQGYLLWVCKVVFDVPQGNDLLI